MAILEKRTSRNKPSQAIPLSRDPLSSVISGVGNVPKISGSGAQSTVSPTLTTRTSGVPKQTLTSTKRPSSSATDKVLNAFAGAALGVGAKNIYDKVTSKPAIPKTASNIVTKTASDIAKDALKIFNDNKAKPPTSVVKPPVINPSTGLPTGTGLGDENDEYTTDSLGNTYKTMPDGTSVLYRATEVPDEYMQDSLGNIYKSMPDGTYELYREVEIPQDGYATTADDAETEDTMVADGEPTYDDSTSVEDSTQYTDDYYFDDYYPDDYYYEDDYYEAKRGGLIAMMKNGGNVRGYYDGGVIEDNADGSYVISYPDGSTETYDSSGEFYDSTPPTIITTTTGTEWPAGYTSNGDGTATHVFDDGSTITVDEGMNPVNSTDASDIPGTSVAPTSTGVTPPASGLAQTGSTSPIDSILGMLPAAGAGALIASLLGSDSGSGSQNQGLDMSKVGVINPRTTDFGIGPTKFVGYEDYGTSGGNYTPNEELLRNLNAPGYNPVNEGDYGYEDAPAEDTPAAPQMASGGLSSMATPVASYYTFGQPADILANLGMRPQPPMNPPEMTPQVGQQQPPQQTQQQGLPQQMPPQMAQQTPQGMPQQGIMSQQQGMPPPMRKGGLPHVSDVPFVEGRMDFRRGSAVHGEGDGQSDDIPAMLADGEYVIDAETVAQIGNGSTKAGAQALDKFREGIRAHKRSAPVNKIPPKTKALTSYLKGVK